MLKNRFKKILVALDGSMHSRRGMNEAISLARQSDGSITGIYILPGLTTEPMTMLNSYRKYLSEKSKKFMSEAKTSVAGREAHPPLGEIGERRFPHQGSEFVSERRS